MPDKIELLKTNWDIPQRQIDTAMALEYIECIENKTEYKEISDAVTAGKGTITKQPDTVH